MKTLYFLTFLLSNISIITMSMEKRPLINPIPEDSIIVFDDSDEEPTFHKQKMLSTNSLANLKDLQNQGAVHTFKELKKELKQKGFKIVEQQPLWRRIGSAFRRYSTTIGVIGTTTMVTIFMYYLYIHKSSINKVEGLFDKTENFIDEAQTILNTIQNLIPDGKIALGLIKDFFNCSKPSVDFIEDLIIARNKLCKHCH